ncbi:MAG: HEAT repeat domain-containing protein [Planctomycetales bacterium]|nr:HEAT repeat domain-containing protein [Planctomycetales bacterium]
MRKLSVLPLALLFLFLCSQASGQDALAIREKSASDLTSELTAGDIDVRRDAAYELVRRLEFSPPVVRALANALNDRDEQVQFQALLGLSRAGAKADSAFNQLADLLEDRRDQIRYRAATALGSIGPAAVAPLIELWDAASEPRRVEIAKSLAIIGSQAKPATEKLQSGLRSDSAQLRRFCAEALAAIAGPDKTLMLSLTKNNDAVVRKVGLQALASFGANDPEVTDAFQSAVGDADAKVRELAVVAIARANVSEELKAESIQRALIDPVPAVQAAAVFSIETAKLDGRDFAMRIADQLATAESAAGNSILIALASIGHDAADALPLIIQSHRTRRFDSDLLAKTFASFESPVVPALLDALQQDPALESAVAKSLSMLGKSAFPQLEKNISSDNELVRLVVIRALGDLRPFEPVQIAHLESAVHDPAWQVRQAVIQATVHIQNASPQLQEDILAATNDPAELVRAAAVGALGQLDIASNLFMSAAERSAKDESARVRAAVADAIASSKLKSEVVNDLLLGLCKDVTASTRKSAINALSAKGTGATDSAKSVLSDTLINALADDDFDVRTAATQAVVTLKLRDDRILHALTSNLQGTDELSIESLAALSGFGSQAATAIPEVTSLLAHKSVLLRRYAVETLADIEGDAPALVTKLERMLDDADWDVRRTAAAALGDMGPTAKPAVAKLFEMLKNEEDSDFASGALRAIDAAPVEALPVLMAGLGSEDRRTGFYSISLLGKIGPPAADALPKLEKMLQEYDGDGGGRSGFVVRMIRQAIASIKGEELDPEQS